MSKKQQFDAQTLKRHHYWIVALLGGIALPIGWYLGRESETAKFTKGKSARDSVRQQVDGFQAGSQPNQPINAELDKRHARLTEEVFKAWQIQYQRQQPAMQWDLASMWNRPLLSLLTEAQAAAFENARTKGAELPQELRSAYAGWLITPEGLPKEDAKRAAQFQHVYKLIELRRPIVPTADDEGEKPKDKEKVGGLGFGGQGAEKVRGGNLQHEGLVYWPASEREHLENKFGRGPAWGRAPSTAQVVYTHESMNVYAMLLYWVVARTNGDQTEHQLLAVKQIVTMRLGEDCQMPARTGAQEVGAPGGPGAGGPGAGGPGAPGVGGPGVGGPGAGVGGVGNNRVGGGQDGASDPTAPFAVDTLGGGNAGRERGNGDVMGGGGGGRGGGGDPSALPPDGRNRYVDDEGFTIADPKKQPYAEFRMLPVVMRFVMDQRRLPELLAHCIESPLPIEVRQWNIRDPRGGAADARGAAGAGGPPGAAVDGAAGKAGGVAVGAKKNPEQGPAAGGGMFGGEIELGPYDKEIEIKGIIYIYNPPDPARVGKGTTAEGEDKVPGDKVPGDKAAAVDASAKAPAPEAGNGKAPAENKAPAEKSPPAKSGAEDPSGAAKAVDAKAGEAKGVEGPVPPPEKAAEPSPKAPAKALPEGAPAKVPPAQG